MMMESLEMSESSKLEESSHMRNRVTTPILPKGEIRIDEAEEEEEEDESITLSPSSPPPPFSSGAIPNSSPSYKTAITKIEKFLSTPSRRIGNNSVEPVSLLQDRAFKSSNNNKDNSVVDYPILSSSPFHIKRKDLILPDTSQQPQISLQTPSGTSVVGDFASSQDDDQQRLTSGGRSEGFRAPRLPCGLTNFHLSLFFGMIGFILFWLVLLLRIYLPVNYFGLPPKGASAPTAAVSSSSASRNITNDELDSKNNSSDSSSSRLLRNSSSSSPPNSSSTSTLHYNHSRSTPTIPTITTTTKQSSSPSSLSTTTSFSSSTRKSPTFSSNPSTSPLKSTFYPTTRSLNYTNTHATSSSTNTRTTAP
ncbi:uncharacterized protein [Lepeophtheirus salmonis]|uniref:uncharacterized protein n=1 Tax=Lepeophtheirus salmonis TaxID=72036 RepID=UPI001AE954BB|nr:uncharacterized serine-rich protein C215.13-like [Lepeophtheirus salmonis]